MRSSLIPSLASRNLHWSGRAALVLVIGIAPLATHAADAPVAVGAPPPAITVKPDAAGRLVYTPDEQGNSIIDFSAAGFGGGGVAIPHVPAKIIVAPTGRGDGERIQAAIDLVAAMPVGANGFRGAVLLQPGRFAITGSLRLAASGIVLRGSGEGENGTVLVAAGNSRRTLIEVGGRGERTEISATRQAVTDAFVPVGAKRLSVENASGFAVGDRVSVRRPATAEWIAALGMNLMQGWRPENRIQWPVGSRDIIWDRVVTSIDGNTVGIDAPITTSLEKALGGGTVSKYAFPGRIENVGVENLRCVSEYDRSQPVDEEHAWVCVSLDKVQNAWVRQVTAQHFVGYVINAQPDSKWVTVEDVTALAPVSEIAGWRRRVFSIGGQLTLVQRCRSEQGLRDFTTGFVATGPNVFLHCRAIDALGHSGTSESWASGVLYDNVVIRGGALRLLNRGAESQGAGWTAANSVIWNSEATELHVHSPPGAPNHVHGSKGLIVDHSAAYDPRWMPWQAFVRGGAAQPASLYLAQLAERMGTGVEAKIARATIDTDPSGARQVQEGDVATWLAAKNPPRTKKPLTIENGQFVIDGRKAWNGQTGYSWYLGQMPRVLARPSGVAITRFSPGETGVGATDNLEEVAASIQPGNAFSQHYGLWYDRRRINHNYYGSPELSAEDVTPPFMEVPWARSGVGRDWNGLSKYDLTKFNPWYFQRVKDFADLADTRGLILHHNFYFQHAVQETRAHYVDFPWRPVNCLQDSGMPDENPAGSTFWDVSHPVRRDLHRLYIRKCLDVLKDNSNVVYALDREYSGPLSFVQFWLDTINEWQKENSRKVFISLEVPKAVMDAILEDPVRRPLVTAIDFHNWNYRPDGTLFAIEGGLNLAPREQITRETAARGGGRGGPPTGRGAVAPGRGAPGAVAGRGGPGGRGGGGGPGGAILRYRALREYRDAYPDLLIPRRADDFAELSAAIEKAIPRADRALTRPVSTVSGQPATSWAMGAPGKHYLVYTMAGEPVQLDLTKERGSFKIAWLDSANGELRAAPEAARGGSSIALQPPSLEPKRPWVAWLTAQP